jgi:hypothetical protein
LLSAAILAQVAQGTGLMGASASSRDPRMSTGNRYELVEGAVGSEEEEQHDLLSCAGYSRRTIELDNDPRFFNDNVLDKRLAAFTALSIVSSIMVGAACDNFVPFEEDSIKFDTDRHMFRSIVALVGFSMMCIVFVLNVIATMVFGVQFYYVYRLMTSGQLGFDSAKSFYLNPRMMKWRKVSVMGLTMGMPLFVMSVGCMLVVKMDQDQNHQRKIACGLLVVFVLFAAFVLHIARDHRDVFKEKRSIADTDVHETLLHLNRLNQR